MAWRQGQHWLLLAVWAVLAWTLLRPASLVNDWSGWRQADTQTIALNTLRPEASPNVPLVNWGGPVPTAAETEFQLYTLATAVLLAFAGDAEWPGQLVSLLALLFAAAVLHGWLAERFGRPVALAGMLLFLLSRPALFLGTSVKPDGLALACFVLGWVAFDRWRRDGGHGLWFCWVAATALAGLLKVTNLQLGIAQFLLLALAGRQRLADPWLWAGWTLVLAANGWQLAHGTAIREATGLTFGITGVGDSKFPALADLFRPGHYLALVRMSLLWGLMPLGLMALLWTAWQRRWSATLPALAVAHGIALVIALRYTTQEHLGSHYHAPAALLAAEALALAMAGRTLSRPSLAMLLLALAVGGVFNLHSRLQLGREAQGAELEVLATELAPWVARGDPAVIRSPAAAETVGFQRGTNNFEDPRLFYLLRTSGWSLPVDRVAAGEVARLKAAGARWWIEPQGPFWAEAPAQWAALDALGAPVYVSSRVKLWRLAP